MRPWIFLAFATLVLTVLAGCSDDGAEPADGPAPVQEANTFQGAVVTPPGEYNFTGPLSRVLTPGGLSILAPERVTIPSPIDGVDIEMGLHRPDTPDPVPILLFASPYFYDSESQAGSRPVTDRAGSFGNLVENFVPHGYAVVALAVRGTAGSDGCNDLMGPMEVTDLDAAVTWLGEQDWSTGAIAMTGVSYDGSTPWSVASTGNPYLKTIIPISGVPDIYGLMYRNGSAESRGPLLLNALYIEGSLASGAPADAPTRLCPEAVEGLALSGVAGILGTDPTGYWQARNRKPNVEANYNGSVFSVQGLQDWNVDPSQVIPWVDQLEASGLRTKQLLGQWPHSWPDNIGEGGDNADAFRADYQEILLRWLDHELKGKDVDTGPAVQVRDNLGRWRNEANFPPHDTNWTTYYLDMSGRLAAEPGPRGSNILLPVVADGVVPQLPPQVEAAKMYLDYVLGPFENETLVVGLPKVHVTVTPHGPGGYLGAYLYDRAPDGAQEVVGWTTMNLAYADGTTTRAEVVPGMPLAVKMEIQPMDAALMPGHSLVLRMWVFTDADRLPTIPPGSVSLEMGDGVESVLRLPTVQRDPSVYFTPPMPPETA